jgi:hypothetical protein
MSAAARGAGQPVAAEAKTPGADCAPDDFDEMRAV